MQTYAFDRKMAEDLEETYEKVNGERRKLSEVPDAFDLMESQRWDHKLKSDDSYERSRNGLLHRLELAKAQQSMDIDKSGAFETEEKLEGNEKLKKKIQEVDIRHEYVGKDLLKKLNAIESKQAQIENQNLQSEFMA